MKVAAIQMCSSHIVEDNLILVENLVKKAAINNAKLVVLPEMFPLFGKNKTDQIDIAEEFKAGKIQYFLGKIAKKFNIWIVGGTIPIICNIQNKIRAACIVFNNNGKIVARYDKIHLFDVKVSTKEIHKESFITEAGTETVVIDTPIGKLGLAVCYDIRFPELFRNLIRKGAEIIAIPAAFTVPTGKAHWQLLTRSRAVDNFCYIIGAGQGGIHTNGRNTYGHSIIIEPWGSILAIKNSYKPGLIYADINLRHLKTIRKNIPILEHSKL